MTSDVRDVLNLPAEGATPRPSKKQKTGGSRPNLKGLAREVQNLGGENPIAIVPEISTFKKRRFGSRKPAARWELKPFRNSAREDGTLHLRHWRKQTPEPARAQSQQQQQQQRREGETAENEAEQEKQQPEELEDSAFSKFNVQVDVPEYNEDQYNSNLTSSDWTKDETDYLFDLARSFDLRWPMIWDRYDYQPKLPESVVNGEGVDATDTNSALITAPKVRTMEDLKARYYEVAAKMMALQKPVQYMTQAEFNLHEVMANFNPVSEMQCKKFAQDSLNRSKEEAREEESLLIEVRRILARTEKFNQERRELYNRLDYPHTDQDISAFKSSTGLQTLLQNLMSVDKSKKRKSIMDNTGSGTPTTAMPSTHQASTPASDARRESIAASSAGRRDSTGAAERTERPSKKGAHQPERKKLNEQEEQLYGVSYHDRLPSGPTFRYERINKILTTKSNAQHQRITNTMTELDIPSRLSMSTRAVVEDMETLLNHIIILLDLRKVSDKLDGEIQVEKAKKAALEKDKAPAQQPDTSEPNGESSKATKTGDGEQSETAVNGTSGTTPANGTVLSTQDDEPTQQHPATNGQAVDGDGDGDGTNTTEIKHEAVDDQGAGPESRGGHKRSASTLSSVSDKSNKRQKN